MADEIELKLELTIDGAKTLRASGFLPGKAPRVAQRSIYFDTPGGDLFAAGFSLRIRKAGGKRIQTIKADGASAAGLFARAEWEYPVKSDQPILDDSTPIKTHFASVVDEIAPAFRIEVNRETWMVVEDDATIEMVLDRGEALSGDRRAPISEIELELKGGGKPGALFALARRIDAIVPVRLGVLTKSERGYRLASTPRKVFKAEGVKLDADATAAQAFQRIVQHCIRHYRLNEATLLVEHHGEALHQARVALRRLRSAFSIFGKMLGKGAGADLRDRLRTLTGVLGTARNLDVLLERATPGPLRDRLQRAREDAYIEVDRVLASPPTRALMLDIVQWAVEGDWLHGAETEALRNRTAREYGSAALNRLRKGVKKDGAEMAKATEDERHTVRKDAKKLRYATEFLRSLFVTEREQRRHKRFVGALEDLQDSLGKLNDLATAPLVLQELGIADEPEAQQLLTSGNRKDLLKASTRAYERLVDAKRFWR